MVVYIKIPLEQDENSALQKIALAELRSPADQARFILREELARRGLLPARTEQSNQTSRPEVVIDANG